MNWRLTQAIVTNDTSTFLSMIQENEEILEQRTVNSLHTVLHVASRLGHAELVKEIVKLRPEMVEAENKKCETPFHEACRRGNYKVLMLLLETNPWVASKLNCENQSALFLACSYGHVNEVNLLLNQQWLLDFDDGDDITPLHVAASKGRTDIVRKIIDTCPNMVQKIDKNGFSPLHYACTRGRIEISAMFLRLDPDLALQYNYSGYTPLHLAAINGNAAILKEFMVSAPTSFQLFSKQGETVLHLSVRFNKYDAFICLAHIFKDTDLFHQLDQYGNTILHIAVTGGRYNFAEYIIRETSVQINCQNCRGHTALDILDQAGSTLKAQNVRDMLNKVGCKKSNELTANVEGINPQPLLLNGSRNARDDKLGMLPKFGNRSGKNESSVMNGLNNHPVDQMPTSELENNPGIGSIGQHKLGESSDIQENKYQSDPETLSRKSRSSTSSTLRNNERKSNRHRKDLVELYKNRHKKQHEIYKDALHNARDTITLVAILIATITFTVGINPPGGVYQEGDHHMRGKSVFANRKAFKVFTICNNAALFASLSIVIVLVSIIPFRRKSLMMLLVIAHKAMWVSVSFMATAYVAATWLIMPQGPGMDWTIVSLMSICAGSLGVVFLGLGVMLTKHWLRKLKWRRERSKLEGTSERKKTDVRIKHGDWSHSSNSDVDSSLNFGYHAY